MKEENFDIHYAKLEEDENYISFFINYATNNEHTNYEESKKVYEKVGEIAKKCNYDLAYAWSQLWLGWYYHDFANYETAIAYHSEALDIFLEKNEKTGLAKTYNGLMGDYIKVGIFELAVEYSLSGLAIAEELKDEVLVITFLINTATAYCYGGHYDEVDLMLHRISNLNFRVSDSRQLIIKSIEADRDIHFKEYEKAYLLCEEGIRLSEKISYYYSNTTFKHLMAKASYKMGNYERASREFDLAIKECEAQGDISTLTEVYIDLADYYFTLNKYTEAEEMLLEAADRAEEISADHLVQIIYNKMGEVYSQVGEYKYAYEATNKALKVTKKSYSTNGNIWFAKLKSKMVVDEARVYKELYDQVSVISKIGKNITASLIKEKTFQSTYEAINNLMKADVFGIALYKPEENVLNYEYFVENGRLRDLGIISLDSRESLGVECFQNKREIIISEADSEVDESYAKESIYRSGNSRTPQSLMFYPLLSGEKAVGIVSVQSYESNAYSSNDLNKLKLLSSFIAVAIENAELFKEIEYLAHYDSLTGIFNRRELLKAGEKVLEECHDKNKSSSVVMLDLDHFKNVNDTFGHQAGDYVLRNVSEIIKSKISREHLLGRYGGEEFLLILPNIKLKEAKVLSEDIRKSIADYSFKVDKNHKVNMSVSMGIYEVNDKNKTSFYDSIKYADKALYDAKSKGRNIVVEYH